MIQFDYARLSVDMNGAHLWLPFGSFEVAANATMVTLCTLGEEGWELVSVTQTTAGGFGQLLSTEFFLKRPASLRTVKSVFTAPPPAEVQQESVAASQSSADTQTNEPPGEPVTCVRCDTEFRGGRYCPACGADSTPDRPTLPTAASLEAAQRDVEWQREHPAAET